MRNLGHHSQHLRSARLYLAAIGLVTFSIIIFCAVSLERQRRVIHSTTVAGMRLSGERLAVELERSIWRLAEECLQDPDVRRIGLKLSVETKAAEVNRARQELSAAGRKHPIAAHFYTLVGGRLRFPPLTAPAQSGLPGPESARGASPAERLFANLVREAASRLTEGAPKTAIDLYRQAYELQVPDRLKALALEKTALTSAGVQRPSDAIRLLHQLRRQFGDCYDALGRPYGLVVPLEIDTLAGRSGRSSREALQEAYGDLLQGRWQLSAAQTSSLQAEFEARLGGGPPKMEQTPYIRHFALARALETGLQGASKVRTYGIETGEFVSDSQVTQAFLTALPAGSSPEPILAFSVDSDWVSQVLLPRCGESQGLDSRQAASFQLASKPRTQADPASGRGELRIPFRSIFPSLELRLLPGATESVRSAARIEGLLAAGALASMCALLGLVALLLKRVSREVTYLNVRSSFLSGVSHDLKTPLAAILLHSEILLSDENLSAEERRHCYEVIARGTGRLNNLIGNLLSFSRIERQKEEYRLAEGDLLPVVETSVRICVDWLSHHDFSVETELDRDLPPVRFDPEKVSQAVANLIDNAGKYSGTSRSVAVRLKSEQGKVIFEVRDNGIGIPPDEQKKVFERFYRAANAVSREGNGLGLFLVGETMRKHGGSVELESRIGEGTTVRLVFPTCDEARGPAMNAVAEPTLNLTVG